MLALTHATLGVTSPRQACNATDAEKQIGEHEKSRASALNNRRQLQAARTSIKAELQMALAVIEREAIKEKAREAREIVAIFRKRGSELDIGLRKLVEDYAAIQSSGAFTSWCDAD